ncbi:MAG: hypothetical protein L6271_11635 [Desulfobacteraceae bacterium]|nr:hypothetical protein [Desulfobacteraceae bacterium]
MAKWAAGQPEDAWQRITTRDSTKGLLQVDILTRQVWVWLDKKQSVRKWHLVVRRETDSQKTIKYSLANAPAETFPERLAYMQGQRFFVERSFQDAKETAGMDHYQVRGWLAWHHHMAMVMMSRSFCWKPEWNRRRRTRYSVVLTLQNCLLTFFHGGI